MHIVVDATAAVRQQAGVGRFARGLLAGLSAVDHDNEYTLVTTGHARIAVPEQCLPLKHRWLRLPVPERLARIAWHRLRFAPSPSLLVRNAGLFFTPDFALPPGGRVPSVLTVHDLSFLVHPECADDGLRRYLAAEVPRSINCAAAIVAVSQTTARALADLLGVDPDRVEVVPNGVDAQFVPLEQSGRPSATTLPFGLPAGYLLSVGTLEPRKNYVRLLQAFSLLRQRMRRSSFSGRQAGDGPTLAIAGRSGWKFEPIFREVARLGLGSAVHFFGSASDEDLLALYQHAGAFVFPSLYEGFGIPPLEAMSCGIPVASSTGGALPEVVGGAALQFDPLDVSGMADAMQRILEDDALRCALRQRGFARARAYTWERAANCALDLFRRVAP